MGLAARIVSSWSFAARRLARLAQIAGASERLAGSLKRHATLCAYTNIKSGLEALAIAEAADAQALRDLLLPYQVWPAPARSHQRAGGSNWARLSDDLAAEVAMVRALNAAIANWEGPDHAIADRLRAIVTAKATSLDRLRALTLRCDPQALD